MEPFKVIKFISKIWPKNWKGKCLKFAKYLPQIIIVYSINSILSIILMLFNKSEILRRIFRKFIENPRSAFKNEILENDVLINFCQ